MWSDVLIIGGSGFFGKLIAEELLEENFSITLAGRNEQKLSEAKIFLEQRNTSAQIKILSFDLMRPLPKKEFIPHKIIIDSAGPFQKRDLSVLKFCAENGIHYMDISDAENFLNDTYTFINNFSNKKSFLFSGLSTIPALEILLAKHLSKEMNSVHDIETFLFIGNRKLRQKGTVASFLSLLDKKYSSLVYGKMKMENPLTTEKEFTFPEPIHKHSFLNIPDAGLILIRKYFPELKNHFFGLAYDPSILQRILKIFSPLYRMSSIMNPLIKTGYNFMIPILSPFATDRGGIAVKVSGTSKNQLMGKSVSLTRKTDGAKIAVHPCCYAAKVLLSEKISPRGFADFTKVFEIEKFFAYCRSKGTTVT